MDDDDDDNDDHDECDDDVDDDDFRSGSFGYFIRDHHTIGYCMIYEI
jgi:hypothetical protein